MSKPKPRLISLRLFYVAILLLFAVLLAQWALVDRGHAVHVQIIAEQEVSKGLHHISDLLNDAFQRHDYVAIRRYLENWWDWDEDVVELSAVMDNGFEIFHRSRPGDHHHTLAVERSLKGADGAELRLTMRASLEQTEHRLSGDGSTLIALTLFSTLVLGLALWWLLQVVAVRPLEREIQRRKRLEEELRQAREQAEAASRAKSSFLANMSHELRTPLNAILGFTQLARLEHGDSAPRLVRDLDGIERGGRYLLTLVNDILDLSRIEAGRYELFPVDWQSEQFFRDLIGMFHYSASDKGLALYYESSPLPKVLHGDEKRLRQILMNLLGNAVKFTQQGQVVLRSDYEQGKLTLQVRDTGPGIPHHQLAEIFEPFRQLGELSQRQQGAGLGLSITSKLVEMMGGELKVESTLGEGATFTLSLPMAQGSELAQATTAQFHPLPTGYHRNSGEGRYRILIREREEDGRLILSRLLIRLGFEVKESTQLNECYQLVQHWKPDMIFTEVRDRAVVCLETLAQDGPKVVAVSGNVFDGEREKALIAGFADYLSKPLFYDQLIRCLERWLDLEWIYPEADEPPETQDQGELSAEQLETLNELLRQGKITAIDQYLNELLQQPQCPAIARELLALAHSFNIKPLRDRLSQLAHTP